MAHPKRYTVTAALPYANGPVHIGHLAGCYLPADIYVRYLRQQKRDVKFICGSDEHGVAITLKARAEGISPQEVVDRYHGIMREAFAEFGISFDIYSRTSDPEHHQTASDFFLKMHEQGSFEQVESQQYYDPEAEQFLADRYIEGTCPNCGHESAYGDQCENCGSSLSPTDLKNPKSRLSGAAPILKNTTHWYLPLNHLSEKIEKYIAAHSDWKPNVYGQCMSWLKAADGLQSRAMTRDLDWGVKVPLAEAEGKVLYVWFDAPIGYISATKKLLGADWEPYWKDKDTKLVHFIGKDNIVFHCIIFPSMLMEHGEYVLPEDVPANEFLNLEGKKISTSRNWAVWLHEYLQDFSGKQDALRYSLCANAPETKDNDFTWKDFQARNNNELVAVYGNFINRVFVLMDKYYGGIVPDLGEVTKAEEELFAEMKGMPEKIAQAIEKYRFREALQHLMNLARSGNKYLADQEPWKVVKQDEARAATILNAALQCAALLSQLSEPFLPFSAQALRTAMGLELNQWSSLDVSALVAGGTQLNKLGLLFEKVEDSAIEAQLQKLEQSRVSNSPSYAPLKPNASFPDFEKMDLRTGVILEAAPVPKTDKLMQLKVDLGFEQRTIVSGIAHQFKGEELKGKSVVVLANLEPRKIRGVLSNGMILMSEDAEGQLHLMAADGGKAGEVVR